ncbi:MAG TPA: GNAT family N-acetyltransferase [Roseibacterium sp.]|nr:GNAT family N-acetyltransferase [Roseibacterium sp.]
MSPAQMARLHAASFPRGWSETEIKDLLAKPTTLLVTNTHGFALLQSIPPEAELLTIVIDPASRGHGHGKTLLTQTLAIATAHGANTVFLEVDATNTPALNLYKAAQFTRTGLRRAYFEHPDGTRSDAITMTCPTPGTMTCPTPGTMARSSPGK